MFIPAARTSSPSTENCADFVPSCVLIPIGPGPAMVGGSGTNNAAANSNAAQSVPIPLPDPSERNPDAALNNYVDQLGPELVAGVVFVVFIVIVGLVLWLKFDKDSRRRLQRWTTVAVSCCRRRKGVRETDVEEGAASPGAWSDVTRVNTRMDENAMRATADSNRALRPTLTISPQQPAAASQVSLLKMEQVSALPRLLSRQ